MTRVARTTACVLRVARGAGGLALWLLLAQPSGAAAVTLNPGSWTSTLTDRAADSLTASEVYTSLTALPSSGTTPGTAIGGSFARMHYALSDAGFAIDFDQGLAAEGYSGGQGFGVISFSIDQDAPYAILGNYQVSGGTQAWGVYYTAILFDITAAPVTLFESLQRSTATPNESFTLGLLEGDTNNVLTGSASGMLLSGHVYRFIASAYVEGSPAVPGATASATGNISLLFVPEPSSGLLLSLGLATLAAHRRPRRVRDR